MPATRPVSILLVCLLGGALVPGLPARALAEGDPVEAAQTVYDLGLALLDMGPEHDTPPGPGDETPTKDPPPAPRHQPPRIAR